MKKWYSLAAFGLFALVANAAAKTTYTYTGVLYTSAQGVYTTSMTISGSFVTASPLPANLAESPIGPGGSNLVLSWSFTDGVNTYTNSNSELLYGQASLFAVGTASNGEINAFSLGFMSPTGTNTVGQPMDGVYFSGIQQATTAEPCSAVTAGICSSIPTGGTNYAQSDTSGTWTSITTTTSNLTAVPALQPSLVGLLAMLILLLGYQSYRRRA